MNLDWKAVHAIDIYAVLDSIVPGKVKFVKVFPSDYGIE
jgi:hypothetical protein